jgi:L-iditol 2-dehydrogenase
MQAARLSQPGTMRVDEVARPAPGPGDVLVRVEATGICGSDRHMFRGEYPTALPVTLGHEFCGIVEAVGQEVEPFDLLFREVQLRDRKSVV